MKVTAYTKAGKRKRQLRVRPLSSVRTDSLSTLLGMSLSQPKESKPITHNHATELYPEPTKFSAHYQDPVP
jgi:hypothetical protein